MPYRRLPNTDTARLKALRIANRKGEEIFPLQLAFPQSVYYQVRSFLPRYEAALKLYAEKKHILSAQNRKLHVIFKKARMFLSHFIQVAFFAVQRGELSEKALKYFSLDNIKSLPVLQSYEDLEKWGKLILEGEEKRTSEGFSPLTNPTAAVVKVRYEQFMDAYHAYKIHRKTRNAAHEEILTIRKKADQLIAKLWDHIESSFKDLPDPMKRQKAAEYGVRYVYRTNETRRIDSL
ncbi:MAG: hypothetical protein J7K46_05695 [Bacteroidales bacterium]|nr:hypothetical protein [Bacteroidales bacterium]